MDTNKMQEILNGQQMFFQQIKEKLPQHLALVDEVEDILGISADSAYRRIRGEKELSFSELQKLSDHFGVSVDRAIGREASREVTFSYNALNGTDYTLLDYLKSTLGIIQALGEAKGDVLMIYGAKDIPLFHYFIFEEIAHFKMFLWQKTLLGFPEFEDSRFALADSNKDILHYGREILKYYNRFPSVEIWNEETINSILRQLEFYCESGLFIDGKEALLIVDKLEEYAQNLKRQAMLGRKFAPGDSEDDSAASFQMYNNEVVLSDNTILAKTPGGMGVFMTHNGFNFLNTRNTHFCHNTDRYFTNLMQKSSLISSVSEKQRNRFFTSILARIQHTRERVKFLVG